MHSRPPLPANRLLASKHSMSLCVALAVLAGCGTATNHRGESWAYLGGNAALRSPSTAIDRTLSQEQQMRLAQQNLDAWKSRVSEALDADKGNCAKETGEPASPSVLFGYSEKFETCMRTRGWQRASNPL